MADMAPVLALSIGLAVVGFVVATTTGMFKG